MPNTRIIPNTQSTDLVTCTVKVNGAAISQAYNLLSVAVKKLVNKIPTARIVLADGNAATESFPISDGDDFAPGNEVEILAGYHSDEETIFKGIITCHGIQLRQGKASVLRIDCKDAAVKMTVGNKSAYFTETTDSTVIEEIAGAYPVDVSVEATDITHQSLVQHFISDWDFMLMRAEANGLLVHVTDGAIDVKMPEVESEGVLSVQYGATMYEFSAEMDAPLQFQKVTGTAWDAANQEMITAEAADPGLTEAGNFSSSDLAAVVGLDSYDVLHPGSIPDQELQAWSDAVLLRSRLAKLRGTVKFQGFAGIKTGDTLEVQGVGERFTGPVFVAGVHHEIGSGNWMTTVQFGLDPTWFAEQFQPAVSPISNLLSTSSGLHIGIVTQLQEDPDSEHRIRVRMPALNAEDEGVWARVACVDAGENRGLFFLPEIDDEVVVGFLADDPRKPIVLGMLNSSAKPAPLEASDENHEKGLVTRSEMKMLFDDDKVAMKLETPAGKLITLDEDAALIGIEDENGNKITLDTNGITIESGKDIILKATGDLKIEGNNIEQKAKINFKAEGSAGLEVSSSAIATLKGSLVQIN